MSLPKISIVTPSYNQAAYLEETMQSVLGQFYPDLEYLIMDGGSTDGSAELIRRHDRDLAYWSSAPDGGQSAAINAGFQRATGDILAWLNSDDLYLPGTLACIASLLNPNQPELILGNCIQFTQNAPTSWGSDIQTEYATTDLAHYDYIIQPATFWTRAAWEKTGTLDASLHFGFDWDWYMRARNAGVVFKPVPRYLALYRIHDAHKTHSGGDKRRAELRQVMSRYSTPAYVELFDQVCAHHSELLNFRDMLKRRRLWRRRNIALKLKFPQLFRQYSEKEIWDLVRMV